MAQDPQRSSEFRAPHLAFWFEAPDVVVIQTQGVVGVDDILQTSDPMKELVRGMPYVLLLVDMSGQTHISPEARKAAAKGSEGIPFRGTVLYGASFATRAAGQMMMTVLNAVTRTDNPSKFVETEAEARAWIDERRRTLTRG
jgi:hypothetical protein